MQRCILFQENVLSCTKGFKFDILSRKTVLDGTKSWTQNKYGDNGAAQERASTICYRDHVNFGHEDHGSARRVLAFQEQCLYAVLFFVALEQVAEFVFADFADKCGCHAEDGCAGDGVGRRASCYIVKSVWFKAFEDFVSGFHIHELHAAFREVVHFKECVVRKDGQYVCEGISYA